MDALFFGGPAYPLYLLVFAAAAAGCLASAFRARGVSLPGVRRGLIGLLVTSGLWALCHVGVLLSPGLGLKTAFYEAGLTIGFGTVFTWLWLCSAYSGRSLHRSRGARWAGAAVFTVVTLAKLTNRWHGLYFSVEWGASPFRHLAVDHHGIYWGTAGLSYALAAVGFFMLSEPLRQARVGGRKLAGLFALTALPLGANAIGYAGGGYLLDLSHEPVGVAAFALGALALRDGQLEETSQAGRAERPSLLLSGGGRIRNYNQAAARLFPALQEKAAQRHLEGGRLEGTLLEEALPELSEALGRGAEENRDLPGKEEIGEGKAGGNVPEGDVLEVTGTEGEARYVRPVETVARRGEDRLSAGRSSASRLVTLQDVTEQELRRREQASRLESISDSMPGVTFELRAGPGGERSIEFVGARAESFLGLSSGPGQSYERFVGRIPEGHREAFLTSVQESVEGRSEWKQEFPFERSGGERMWILGSAQPEILEAGESSKADEGNLALLFRGLLLDVTERKEAERKLRRERDRLETLFESLPSPIVRCRAEGGKATVEEANPAFVKTFGAGQEEAEGQDSEERDLEGKHLEGKDLEGQDLNDLLVPPGRREAAAEIDRRALEEEPSEHQVRRRTASGEIRDFRLQVAGRQPAEGPPEIFSIYTDITGQKRRERRLQQAETLFQNAQDALFLIDVEPEDVTDSADAAGAETAGKEAAGGEAVSEEFSGEEKTQEFSVRRINPAFEKKTGLSSGDLCGRSPQDVFGEEIGAEIEEKYRKCAREREPLTYEEEVPLEGTMTYWTTCIAPVIVEGEVRQIVGTTRDVTEERRRKRELRRQKSLLEQTQRLAGAWEANLQTGEVSWSEKIYEIYEMDPSAEVSLEAGLEFYTPESKEKITEATEALTEEGEAYDLELQIETAEGNRRWVRSVGAPAETNGVETNGAEMKGEEVTEVAGALQDITGRKEEERRRQEVIRRVTDGIIEVDEEWRVTLVNDQAEKIYGMGEEEMLGKSVWEVFGGLEGTEFEEAYREVMQSREPAEVEEYYAGLGEWFAEQVYPNEGGGLAIYFEVTTERKEREKSLRRAKRRYQTLIEHFPDGGAYLFGRDLRYMLAGGEKIGVLGDPEDIIGAGPRDILPEKLAREQERHYRRALEGERAEFEQEYKGRHYRVQTLPVRGEDGTVTSGIVFSQDITDQKRRKEELERQNDLFERAQEIASVGAWEYDVASGEVTWTDEVHRIYGYGDPSGPDQSAEDAIEAYHPDDRPVLREALAAAVEDGEPYDIEARLVTETGEERWVRTRGKPQWEGEDEEGKVARVRGTIQDITGRKEREQALRDTQEELRSTKNFYEQILEQTPIDLAVFSPEAEFEYVNSQSVQDPEVREWILGRTNEEYCRERGTLDPELGKRRDRAIRAAAREKQVAELEERIETEEGQTHYLRVHSPVTGLDGEVESVAAFGIEITERKEREEALQERQEKLGGLYEATNHLLQAEDPEDLSARLAGLVRQALGYQATTVRLARGGELVPTHVPGVVKERMPERPSYDTDGDTPAAEAYRSGETRAFEDLSAELEAMDRGDIRATAYVPMGGRGLISVGSFEAGGVEAFDLRLLEVLAGYAALVLDRLEREDELLVAKDRAEEARQEAEEAARLKSSMLANMSHEIRTPLTSIIGFAEAIGTEFAELELPGGSPLPKYADLIEQGGKRLLKTLEGVLNLSKLEAGQMEMESRPVSLEDQACRAADELRARAEEKGVGLELKTSPAATAEADEGGVQIVLRNLLSNAIKYTEEGTVRVRTYQEGTYRENGQEESRKEEGQEENGQEKGQAAMEATTGAAAAVLEVEDTGIGMDPEAAESLFEPFRQASEGWSREYEGTGIGLAVTREAAQQMGGTIEVDTAEGEGTRVTVRLPLARQAETA
ncbi:PAS domain-containing protein [Salinibacter grassmerensis]|uniref:PAS domain-containing protein n=1 Tax=Salinibacter grassmerensis TaxID=3040353 RepID=UPI0021E7C9AE|nr:PAS domain-containing protein [Salinibacter grassmerensis]